MGKTDLTDGNVFGFHDFNYRLLSRLLSAWVTWERSSFPFLFPASLWTSLTSMI